MGCSAVGDGAHRQRERALVRRTEIQPCTACAPSERQTNETAAEFDYGEPPKNGMPEQTEMDDTKSSARMEMGGGQADQLLVPSWRSGSGRRWMGRSLPSRVEKARGRCRSTGTFDRPKAWGRWEK
jgi:hypothetical protein